MNREDQDLPGVRPVPTPEPDASVVGLLRQLTREVPDLFTKELALAKAELQASLTTLKAGIAGVAGGGDRAAGGVHHPADVRCLRLEHVHGAVVGCAHRWCRGDDRGVRHAAVRKKTVRAVPLQA